jgi:hypothetical protein
LPGLVAAPLEAAWADDGQEEEEEDKQVAVEAVRDALALFAGDDHEVPVEQLIEIHHELVADPLPPGIGTNLEAAYRVELARRIAQRSASGNNLLPTVAAECLKIDREVFLNDGAGLTEKLKAWMDDHRGSHSYVGARIEAIKRLQDLRAHPMAGAPIGGAATGADEEVFVQGVRQQELSIADLEDFLPTFTIKGMREKAEQVRGGGITDDYLPS